MFKRLRQLFARPSAEDRELMRGAQGRLAISGSLIRDAQIIRSIPDVVVKKIDGDTFEVYDAIGYEDNPRLIGTINGSRVNYES